MISPTRYVSAILLSLFSLLAYAADPPLSQPNPPVSANTTATQPSELLQLKTSESELKTALASLQTQSSKLEASLSELHQRIAQSSSLEKKQTPENTQELEALRAEYLQVQNSLKALQQQETRLQAHVLTLNQQLPPQPTAAASNTKVAVPAPAPTITTTTNTATTTIKNPAFVSNKALPAVADTQHTQVVPAQPSASTQATPVQQIKEASAVSESETKPVMTKVVEKPAAQHTDTTKIEFSKEIHTKVQAWLQDPVMMLRIGGGFISIALLLLILLFWPKSQRKNSRQALADTDQPPLNSDYKSTDHPSLEEAADITSEYDFMNTDAAIPTRLDLARGYLEMEKYADARAAIQPVLTNGDELQKQEARALLEKINQADMHI